MRWEGCIVLAGLIAASACHGPPIKEATNPDGGAAGHGGGSGAAGTGAAGTGAAGTGAGGAGAGTGGSAAGSGGGVATGAAGAGTGGATAGHGGGGGSAGAGGSGGTGGAAANACARCETPCKDGVCDLSLLRASQSGGVQSSAMSVALNDGRLYYVVGPGVQVLSIAAAGGPETELYPYHDCSGCQLSVAVDGADVFFAGQNVAGTNSILAVPKAGGGAERIVCMTPQAIPGALTLEGDYVYYVRADTGIERCPKAGGTTMHAGTAGSASSPNVVIRTFSRPGEVLWGDRDTGVVTRLDTNGLTTKVVGITTTSGPTTYPIGVCDAVDDGTLAYWVLCAWPYTVYAEAGNMPNAPVERASALGGGDPNAIFDQYGSLGLDGGYIYFTEAGFLDRVPTGGGTVEARARMLDGNNQYPIKTLIVGFDDRYVYLARANTGDGAIYRVVK